MRNLMCSVFALSMILAATASAQATCPNAQTSVTIFYPTGTADVVMVDQTTCNALNGADFKVYNGPNAGIGIQLTTTTKPAVTGDAAGLHFTANGAPFGLTFPLFLQHTPSGKSYTMTAVVGGVVQGVVGTTTTP